MNEKLKQAIRTIAEYDGWEYLESRRFWYCTYPDKFSNYHQSEETMPYHTSADALLPVWRKVRDKLKETDDWSYEYGKMYDILKMIGFDDLPSACIKLAEIINSLKEQK